MLRLLPHAVELVDLLGQPRHFPRLLRHARRTAATLGRDRVEAWITASHKGWLKNADPEPGADDSAVVEPINVSVPANVHTPGYEPARLQGRWFLMGGDTDFH